ncbi:MAG TPA: malate synthase A [Candidatus Tumulicola sp.]|nr:malate synthase A [Candidatus Tumulicola sp.]
MPGQGRIQGAEIQAPRVDGAADILTPQALDFLLRLSSEFEPRRRELLDQRAQRQREFDAGALPDFLTSTKAVRADTWRGKAAPRDLTNRRVEITGPVERKMMINALNSGAQVFLADFEDANTPTWENLIAGHVNLIDAYERRIELKTPDKHYKLGDHPATLVIRPRGWHLPEKHALIEGKPMSGSLFDFGLYMFHNGKRSIERGSGPYFYLPKLESHLEARLWNDVFNFAQDALGMPRGTIRATVLIETILAAFEMDEILYELRDHSAGLNAGRWDYMFSIIKKFRNRAEFVLPDRAQIAMTVPFMRAYTELLVKTCHRRGVHAIGGMAAFIPSRRDAKVNEAAIARVREDKIREANDGFDGTWVAHPDLVPIAREEFDRVLGPRPNQLERQRDDVHVSARQLLDVAIQGGAVTDAGVRTNVSVGLQYLDSWLRGIGAAGINNLMEDVATAEISRSQLWQWVRHGRRTRADVERSIEEETGKASIAPAARKVFERVALSDDFTEFLTLPAYELLP